MIYLVYDICITDYIMDAYIYIHTLLSRNQTWLAIKCSFSWMMFPSINAHLVEAFLASFDDTPLRVHPSHSSQVDGMQGWVPHQHRFAVPQNPSPSSIQISSPEDNFFHIFSTVPPFLWLSKIQEVRIFWPPYRERGAPYPIGSMVLAYMLTWLGYIDGIHGTPLI